MIESIDVFYWISSAEKKSISFFQRWHLFEFFIHRQSIDMSWISLLVLFLIYSIVHSFSPDTNNFDDFGIKIAANNVLFVQARGTDETFLVQFSPYNYTNDTLQCTLPYDDATHYVYSVGVGIKQNATTNSFFYFSGEVVSQGGSSFDASNRNGTFIGVWINRDPQSVLAYSNYSESISCDYFQADKLTFLASYDHQEYFVMGVEPYGQYAFGIATDFVFRYQPFPNPTISTQPGALVWPNNVTFYPCATDVTQTFMIVAGFVQNSPQVRVRATPTVYLIWNTNLTVLSTWSYTPTNNSWQSRLTYSGISSSSSQHTMSVKINIHDTTRVLVGMPFINTIFIFRVENNGTTLRLTTTRDNGPLIGFGKSVTWLTQSQAAILVTSYSLDSKIFYSSKIYVYTSMNSTQISSSPTAVIPNAQQPIPFIVNNEWIRLISTPSSLAILDITGGTMMILAEQPGYYASTDLTNSPVVAAMPVISHRTTCMGGTYKNDSGVHPCQLCPSGSRNSDENGAVMCVNCSSQRFCPLGALYEINDTWLANISQAYTYPRSPETDVFEDILLHNMFSLGSTGHCLVVSPIFWILILLFIIVVLLILMASMNLCIQQEKREVWQAKIKSVFQRTDFVVCDTH